MTIKFILESKFLINTKFKSCLNLGSHNNFEYELNLKTFPQI